MLLSAAWAEAGRPQLLPFMVGAQTESRENFIRSVHRLLPEVGGRSSASGLMEGVFQGGGGS